ncbi:MAG: hypothetical protein K2W97_00325 [Chthoniobacterales bacterium]|nr:hypothetical protein [Chthoniobacterales bacterium]
MNTISNQYLDRYENFAAQTSDQTAKVREGMLSGKLETEGNVFGRAIQYFFGGGRNQTVKNFTAVLQQKYGGAVSGDEEFKKLQQEAIKGGLTPEVIKSMAKMAQAAKELETQKVKSARGENVLGVVTLASVPDRADIIRQKQETYRQELKSLSPNQPDRAAWCEKMIGLLDQASTYQAKINKALLNPSTDLSSKATGYQRAERLIKLENFQKVNDRPNKLELLIEEIEKEKEQLTIYQKKLEEVNGKLATAAPGSIGNHHPLNKSREDLTNAIKHQQNLIEHQIASADYIRPPFEKMDETTQKAKEEKKWNIVAEKVLARSQYFFSEAVLTSAIGEKDKRSYLNHAGEAFWSASEEAQQTNPNPEIINCCFRSAELLEQAVKAFDEGKFDKATYLDKEATVLFGISKEAHEENPNPEIINCCLRGAGLFEQAVNAVDEGKIDNAMLFSNAGDALFDSLMEAKKENPNQEIIGRHLRVAELYEQAAKAVDEGKLDQITYLANAINALQKISKEEKKRNPNPEIINRYLRSAELYEQAAKTFDEGKIDKANYLNNAGDALWKAAKEAKKEEPDQEVVSYYLRFSKVYEEAVKAFDEGKVDKATYLNNATNAFLKAVEEEFQKTNPNQEIIDHCFRSGNLHMQAVNAVDEGNVKKGTSLNGAGIALYNAAQEAQKENPNKKVITGYLLYAKIAEESVNEV